MLCAGDTDDGPYLCAKEAFGGFVGFEVGFVIWAIRIIAETTRAVAFTTVLSSIFPYFATAAWKMLAVPSVVVILAIINIAGVRLSKVIINTVTISKLIPLILFVAIGILRSYYFQREDYLFSACSYFSNFALCSIYSDLSR